MAKKAISKTQSLSRGAYDADENLRLALTHLIQIIGEAGRKVSREFSGQHPGKYDCLDVLTGDEAQTDLNELLSSRPDLISDARRAANALLATVSFADVAADVLGALQALGMRCADGRSGIRLCGSAWGASRLPSAALRRFAVLTRPARFVGLAIAGAPLTWKLRRTTR